jgi:ABC-2 type transport system permease protein
MTMDAIRKALAVMVKDPRVVSQDRGYLISMLIFPIIISFLNAAMNPGGDKGINLPMVVINQDTGVYGASIAKILGSIEQLKLSEMDLPAAAEEKVARGEYLAAMVIPLDFSKRIDDYQPTEITVILDPAQSSYGRILTGILEEIASGLAIQGEIRYGIRTVLADMGIKEQADPSQARAAQAQVEGVIFTQMQRMETDAPIQVLKDVLKGRQVFSWDNLFSLMLPALGVMFAFFITAAVSTDLIREREAGSLRRLVAAPLPRGSLIGGKILAYTLVVVLQVAILFGLGVVLTDMPLGNSPLGLILNTLCLGLVATTLSMLVAALSRSIDQAGSISLLLIFVLGFLGGSFSPQVAFYRGEGFMAFLSRYTPQAQATIAYHTMLLQNGGLIDILPQIVYLLGLSLVFFLIAIWRFKFE